MKDFGLHMIAKGLVSATFREMMNPYNHAIAVVHIAHGTELLMKARIAEEHPLLIFATVPKSTTSIDSRLGIIDLMEKGQSITYSELPERLLASTVYRIKNLEQFINFGKVRNQIVHLAVPEDELSDLCYQFVFTIVEDMTDNWWGTTIL